MSELTTKPSGDITAVNLHLEHIENCNHAINTACRLLSEFQLDDDFNDEIPEDIKNDSARAGLLACIEVAVNYSAHSVEWLKEREGAE